MRIKDSDALLFLQDALPKKSFAVINAFLESFFSDRSRDTYLFLLKGFVQREGIDPLVVTVPILENYVRKQVVARKKPQTIGGMVNALRSLNRYASETVPGFSHTLKQFRLRLPKVQFEVGDSISKRILTSEQIGRVFRRIEDAERILGSPVTGGFLLRFLLESGLRISEAVGLEHFDPSNDSDSYVNYLKKEGDRFVIRVLGKAEKLREFQLSESFGVFLSNYFEDAVPGTPVFTSARGTRLTRFAARYQVLRLQKRFMGDMNLRSFGCHSLRHTLINHLLTVRGEHPILVSKTVGNTPEILAKYYLHGTKDILKTMSITP